MESGGNTTTAAAAYRAKRMRQIAARKRGPFVRDTATDSEMPARTKAMAYRILNTEISEERMSAHHLVTFRKYVEELIEGVSKNAEEAEKLQSDESALDEATRGTKWWDLPRIERWLTDNVKNWAKPIADQTPQDSSLKRLVTVSTYGAKGTRQAMEDYHCSYLHWSNYFGNKNGDSTNTTDEYTEPQSKHTFRALGVFDGHGGSEAASFTRDQLPQEVLSHDSFPHDVETAFIESFRKINTSFLERAEQVECDAGTTALMCLMNGNTMHFASVGDCGAVIGRADGTSELLTHPHIASNPKEAAAVTARGGVIRDLNGNLRVDGVVSVTRVLGCRPCSEHTSCIPEVFSVPITPLEELLILGSDGLWDVLSPQEAVDFVKEKRREMVSPFTDLAPFLCAHAISLGSKDNVTAIISVFEHG
eukprot:TRINITY_DN5149_c1_g5_i1.p1 TRINITY_DN5149_c1_g5~~TRINITY_DN5149_c1_g5_i1.p1  ORF type:complete len:420 (+),score=46.91 TRINITY_DN5149_c1_g5_i1:111-1370(+)